MPRCRPSSCQRPPLRFSLRFTPARLRAAAKRRIFASIRVPTYLPLRAVCELLALGASFHHLGHALLGPLARGRQRVAAMRQGSLSDAERLWKMGWDEWGARGMGCRVGTWGAAALWGLAVSRSACRVRGGGGERAKVRRAGRRGRCFGWEEGARTALVGQRDAACKVSNSLDTPERSRP